MPLATTTDGDGLERSYRRNEVAMKFAFNISEKFNYRTISLSVRTLDFDKRNNIRVTTTHVRLVLSSKWPLPVLILYLGRGDRIF